VLLFVNHSSTSCIVQGYPGVAGVDGSGQQIAQATRTLKGFMGGCLSCTAANPVTLTVGATASAVVEAESAGPGPCTAFASLLVTAPNTTTSVQLPGQLPSCAFQIHPVVSGSTGDAP
jgi:hypothetical protein